MKKSFWVGVFILLVVCFFVSSSVYSDPFRDPAPAKGEYDYSHAASLFKLRGIFSAGNKILAVIQQGDGELKIVRPGGTVKVEVDELLYVFTVSEIKNSFVSLKGEDKEQYFVRINSDS